MSDLFGNHIVGFSHEAAQVFILSLIDFLIGNCSQSRWLSLNN